jgi:RHS repeat-associated protein
LTRITDNVTASRGKAYVYDKLGRLTQAKGGSDPVTNPQWTQSYSYDRYGNRTSVSKSGPGAGSLPLDGLAALAYSDGQGKVRSNRITTAGYQYDAAGNLTRGETDAGLWRRYQYDAAGRLVTALADDGVTVQASYGYGASNQRLKTVESGTTTYYAWGGSSVLAEYQEPVGQVAVQWDKSYVYLGARLLATRSRSQGVRYHHPDRLGTRVVTDPAGNKVTEQVTLPYGTALDGEGMGTATNRRFTSYDRSLVTKLDYAVNRFYNAGQGRFTQVDPIGMEAVELEDPQSLNLYTYCGNDPINHIDPDGLFFKKLFKWITRIFKWIAIAVTVAVAVLTIIPAGWAGTVLAKLAIFAAKHQVLAALLGLKGPSFIIHNLASKAGVAAAGFWTLAGIGAVNSFLQSRSGVSRGGEFSDIEYYTLVNVLAIVRNRLSRPRCARHLGGVRRAMRLLDSTSFVNAHTINPSYRGPDWRAAQAARHDSHQASPRAFAWTLLGRRQSYVTSIFWEQTALGQAKSKQPTLVHSSSDA